MEDATDIIGSLDEAGQPAAPPTTSPSPPSRRAWPRSGPRSGRVASDPRSRWRTTPTRPTGWWPSSGVRP